MRCLILAAVAALILAVGVPPPAFAAPVDPTYTELTTDRIQTDYDPVVLVSATDPVPMIAGKSYALTAGWAGQSTYDTGSLMEQRMRCSAPGVTTRYSARASTNVLAHSSNSIDNRWLFTPTTSGDYLCELLAIAGHSVHRDRFVDVTAAALTVYTEPRTGGREWRITADDRRVNSGSPTTWALKKSWTAPPGTTEVRLWSGPEVSCYSTGAHNPFVAEVTTVANQVGASGRVHRSWSQTTVEQIPGGLRHLKFGQTMTLTPRPDKPLNFRFSVRLRWVPYDGISDRHGGILHGKSFGTITRTTNVYSALHVYPLAGA